jgi:hypothetical protein
MRLDHRLGGVVSTPIAACLTCLAAIAAQAADVEHSGGARCQADALEQWYCAAEPKGSAVIDELGRVVCAPGACVRQRTEGKEEWQCSTTPGGSAAAAPEGPRCDGACRSPVATACRKL